MLASCTIQEIFPDRVKSDQEGTVTFTFDVTTPDMQEGTRAFADHDSPRMTHLYVAVFGEAGWKQEYVEAKCVDGYPTVNGVDGKKQYEVELTILKEPCHIHFLGFADDDHGTMPFGPEEEVLAQMKTENQNVAYWRMIDAPKGITYKDPNAAVKELNDDTRGRLANIELVRNFAKYTISSAEGSGFTLESARVVNVPNSGYVPAYNKTTGKFVTDFSSYQALLDAKYIAANPVGCTLIKPDMLGFTLNAAVGGVVTDYSYERELPVNDPACVIVKGIYNGAECFYRIDLTLSDDNSKHYAVFRNFNYTIIIKSIKAKGYTTPTEAYEHGSSGDISADVRYEDLNTISNGFSRLDVQFTEATVLSPASGDPDALTFKLRFQPDITAASFDNTQISITVDAASTSGAAFQDESETWNSYLHGTPTVDAEGFSTITIHPNKAQNVRLSQTFTVKGVNDDGIAIQRVITIIVLPQQQIILSPATQTIAEEAGTEVDFYISLPKGLPTSIFPLELEIEAAANSITPVAGENLTVKSGKSLFDSTKPGYQFVRTVSLDDYADAQDDPDNDGFVKLTNPCKFKTSFANSASEIKVDSKYFVPATTYYNAAGLSQFTSLSAAEVLVGLDGSTTLSFTMGEIADVTITLENGTIGGKTTYTHKPLGIGVQTISGIEPSTSDKPIIVKLSADGYADNQITIARKYLDIFSNVQINGGANVPFGAATTSLTFDVSQAGIPVTVTLTNATIDGNGTYTFTPSADGTQTKTLTPTSKSSNITVKLTADNCNTVTKTANRTQMQLTISGLKETTPQTETFGLTDAGPKEVELNATVSGGIADNFKLKVNVQGEQTSTQTTPQAIPEIKGNVRRTGNNGQGYKYTYSFTYDSNYVYFYSDEPITESRIEQDGTRIEKGEIASNLTSPKVYYVYARPKNVASTDVTSYATLKLEYDAVVSNAGSYTIKTPVYGNTTFEQSSDVTITLKGEPTGNETVTLSYGSYSRTFSLKDIIDPSKGGASEYFDWGVNI